MFVYSKYFIENSQIQKRTNTKFSNITDRTIFTTLLNILLKQGKNKTLFELFILMVGSPE